jgi:hypothetical protein
VGEFWNDQLGAAALPSADLDTSESSGPVIADELIRKLLRSKGTRTQSSSRLAH